MDSISEGTSAPVVLSNVFQLQTLMCGRLLDWLNVREQRLVEATGLKNTRQLGHHKGFRKLSTFSDANADDKNRTQLYK
jgi:hypothetical protein